MTSPQQKQSEWHDQWSLLQDDELSLFLDWIHPNRLEDFRGKSVLEGGCGGGQHTAFIAPYARETTAVDLNTVDIARERNRKAANVRFVDADLLSMDLGRTFDVVLSIGVVHHTDDPDRAVMNLMRHLSPGGRLILWVYSREGNALVEYGVEPFRRLFLRRMPRTALLILSRAITALLYPIVYTLYRLPLTFLPYYEYFENFRRLRFVRNVLNVFDKLNAPQVQLISEARAKGWVSGGRFKEVHVSRYRGVSWRISATLV